MELPPLPQSAPSATAAKTTRRASRRGPRANAGFVLLGLALLGAAAVLDARDATDAPWSGTVYAMDGDAPWDGTIAIQARWLPLINYPLRQELYTRLRRAMPREEFEALGLQRTETLIVAEVSLDELRPLLDSGRLPFPGQPEVLAGAYAGLHTVRADDAQLEVVGRLKRNVAGLATAYLMPAHEDWAQLFDRTTTRGWLDPGGAVKLEDPALREDLDREQDHSGMPAAASAPVSGLSIVGLALVAVGGAGLHQAAFARGTRRGITAPARLAFGEHPRLVRAMHTFLYGAFFFSMAIAMILPQLNAAAMEYVRHAFSEGSLGYVGDAYRSGNVLRAAAATWANNYLLQTVALTVLLSIVVPCLGLLKTLASFALVGVGMAPIWTGMAAQYTFHSITMLLELEAYIYVCAAVVIFWMRVVAALRQRRLARVKEGFRILASATLLSGIMLAIAGLYEAATLILLR